MQIDGVSMGSPLAPALTKVFITHIEQKLEKYDQSDQIKMYLRYVDDPFIIMNSKQSDVDQLFKFVSTLHPKLKFTCESEKNYQLPFLDVKVI